MRRPTSDSSGAAHRKNRSLKTLRLGLFDPRPMTSPTVAVQALDARDAVEVVDRKIKRALLAGAEHIRIIFSPEDRQVKKALLNYLTSSAVVKEVDAETDRDDEILVSLVPMA